MTTYHKNLRGDDYHPPGYVRASDPGVVGSGILWVDKSGGANAWEIKIRNDTDSGWENIISAIVIAHKNSHDPEDGSDPLDTATPSELAVVQAAGEGSSHSFARADHQHQIQHAITDNHIVTIDGSPNDDEYARFTANGLEGRTTGEVKTDLGFMTDVEDDTSPILGGNLNFNNKTAENIYSLEFTNTEQSSHSGAVGRVYYDTNYVSDFTELGSGTYGGLAIYAQKWAAIIDTNNMIALAAKFDSLTVAGDVDMKRTVEIVLLDNDTALETGDDFASFYWCVPAELNGYNITDVDFWVSTASTSGAPSFDLYNVTDSTDILSVNCTIDANEKTSYTATTGPTINTAYDDLATGDLIRFDCDAAGTGTKGCGVILVVEKP